MKKKFLLPVLIVLCVSVYAQNIGNNEDEIINVSDLPEGTIITSVGANGEIIETQYHYPEDDEITGYIVQLKTPPFNPKDIIKKNKGKSKKEIRESLKNEMQLMKVFHKKFKKDLRKIEKKHGIPEEEQTIISNEWYHALNGFGFNTLDIRVADELRKLKYVKSVNEIRGYFYAIDDESNQIIQADEVWSQLGATGTGITISILDTGIDTNHVEFQGKEIDGKNFVSDITIADTASANYMDIHGHGTHCAGIAAANGPELQGVAPDADIIALKILGDNGKGYLQDIIDGIEYAVQYDVDGDPFTTYDQIDILSMSIGTGGAVHQDMDDAVNNAFNAGKLCVIAAGNDYTYL